MRKPSLGNAVRMILNDLSVFWLQKSANSVRFSIHFEGCSPRAPKRGFTYAFSMIWKDLHSKNGWSSISRRSRTRKNVRERSRGRTPPPPPHIGDYVIHFEARIFGIFVPRSPRDLVFVMPVNRIFIIARLEKRPRALQGEDPPPPHPLDLLDLMDPLYPMDLTDLTDPKHSGSRALDSIKGFAGVD